MEKRSRLHIFERKEVLLLGGLASLVAIFAFTFGLHLGKRVPPRPKAATPDVQHVNQLPDKNPSRAEAQEQAPAAEGAVAPIVEDTLREEVAASGMKLDKPIQTELPGETPAEARKGAKSAHSEQKHTEEAPAQPSRESLDSYLESALERAAPQGGFTLQVSAVPADEAAGAGRVLEKLAKAGVEAWVREAEVSGKGRWFRIYHGGFVDRAAAEQAGQKLKSAGKIASFVVSKAPSAGPSHH